MTGEVDWVSDGVSTIKITNGHPLLADITGSGCMVGTSVATFCAAANLSASQDVSPARLVKGNMLSATVAGYVYIHCFFEPAYARDLGYLLLISLRSLLQQERKSKGPERSSQLS